MCIPERIEHIPPEILYQLINANRFEDDDIYKHASGTGDQHQIQDHQIKSSVVNVKFIQAASSADIFSLGLILLQIATGCPAQLDLPLKIKCRTIDDSLYVATPYYGHCENG